MVQPIAKPSSECEIPGCMKAKTHDSLCDRHFEQATFFLYMLDHVVYNGVQLSTLLKMVRQVIQVKQAPNQLIVPHINMPDNLKGDTDGHK